MLSIPEAQSIIDKEFQNLHFSRQPLELYHPIEYILSVGGKRIRPVLTLMACSLYSDDISPAIMPALGLELFHNFTLLHDDIMDNANTRRNQPTVHIKWNNNTAILSGDAMCIKAYQYIVKCKAEILTDVIHLFNQTALEVCEGQQHDMNFESIALVSEKEYINMIRLKTSVLLAACLKIGALCGGAGILEANQLYEYGINVGLAFQLQDDLLDVYADEMKLGKETGKDIISNKKTFLLIKALELAQGDLKKELDYWLQTKIFDAKEKVQAVTRIYNALEIEKITQLKFLEYFQNAENILHNIEVDMNRKSELHKFANTIKNRIF